MTESISKTALARLDLSVLVERSRTALDEGDPNLALNYIRAAVRRAPLRDDLRALMLEAIEQGGETHAPGAGTSLGASRARSASKDDSDEDDTPLSLEDVDDEQLDEADDWEGTAIQWKTGHRARESRSPSSIAIMLAMTLIFGAVFGGLLWRDRVQTKAAEVAAIIEAREAERRERERARTIEEDAHALETQDQYDLAIAKLEELSEGPNKEKLLASAYAGQGDRHVSLQEYSGAVKAYDNAQYYAPLNYKYKAKLGRAYYLLGRRAMNRDPAGADQHFSEALFYLDDVLGAEPENVMVLYAKARIELARNNVPEMANYLRRVIEIDPDSPEGRKAKGIMEQRRLR